MAKRKKDEWKSDKDFKADLIVRIIGETGRGKTTLADIIAQHLSLFPWGSYYRGQRRDADGKIVHAFQNFKDGSDIAVAGYFKQVIIEEAFHSDAGPQCHVGRVMSLKPPKAK